MTKPYNTLPRELYLVTDVPLLLAGDAGGIARRGEMTEDQAFLKAIAERPDDDAPRLIYADWLDECGTAKAAARAEFIRRHLTACAQFGERAYIVGRTQFVNPECKDAFHQAMIPVTAWSSDSKNYPDAFWFRLANRNCLEWRRGFIESITLPCAAFLTHAAQIIEAVPMVQEVVLTDKEPYVINPYNDCSHWSWVHECIEMPARYTLPTPIFFHLRGRPGLSLSTRYESREEALRDLNQACLAYAKD